MSNQSQRLETGTSRLATTTLTLFLLPYAVALRGLRFLNEIAIDLPLDRPT